MISDDELVIPDELIEGKQILSVGKSPEKEEIGILVIGENMDPESHTIGQSVLRIYLLNRSDGKYHVNRELEAFAFEDMESAFDFLIRLPKMNALELLIMMSHSKNDHDEKKENELIYLQ